jgi:hypothetical protein
VNAFGIATVPVVVSRAPPAVEENCPIRCGDIAVVVSSTPSP